jgi:hypothetical protein
MWKWKGEGKNVKTENKGKGVGVKRGIRKTKRQKCERSN